MNREYDVERDSEECVKSTMAMAETTLCDCSSSLLEYERRERILGERIYEYRELMRRREGVIRRLGGELLASRSRPSSPGNPSSSGGEIDDDENVDDDPGGAKCDYRDYDAKVRRLDVLRARHEVEVSNLRDVVRLHVDIVAEVETLRRGMETLVAKRDEVAMKLEESRELVIDVASSSAAAGHDDDEEGVVPFRTRESNIHYY
jgi:hypothetical protein